MQAAFSETAEGVRVQVRVVPKAGRSEVCGLRGGRVLVRVTAAPEDGKANAAAARLLADALGVPLSSVEVLSGATARDKTLLLHGATLAQLAAAPLLLAGES